MRAPSQVGGLLRLARELLPYLQDVAMIPGHRAKGNALIIIPLPLYPKNRIGCGHYRDAGRGCRYLSRGVTPLR